MADTITSGFDLYQIFYYSQSTYEAIIQVYAGDTFAGRMVFVKDGTALPPNEVINPLGVDVPSLYYYLSRFNDVIETLRQEKPLYLFLNKNTKAGMLATSEFEPVGEQEGV